MNTINALSVVLNETKTDELQRLKEENTKLKNLFLKEGETIKEIEGIIYIVKSINNDGLEPTLYKRSICNCGQICVDAEDSLCHDCYHKDVGDDECYCDGSDPKKYRHTNVWEI